MTHFWGRYALVLLIAGVCTLGFAVEKKSSRSKSTKSATVKKEAVGGRLPRYFSSLVDEEQRWEIYEIQAKYRDQIEELEKELAELEMEQLEAMEKVLTTSQRKELAALRSAASDSDSKKSSSSSKKRSSSKKNK